MHVKVRKIDIYLIANIVVAKLSSSSIVGMILIRNRRNKHFTNCIPRKFAKNNT